MLVGGVGFMASTKHIFREPTTPFLELT